MDDGMNDGVYAFRRGLYVKDQLLLFSPQDFLVEAFPLELHR